MSNRGLSEMVGISLPEDQVGVVCRHASATEYDQRQKRDCKEYAAIGSSVILSAYAVYLYLERGVRDKDDLSQRLSSARQHVTSTLYKKYSLEDFVIVGPSEQPGTKHEDIAQRLVAAIYFTHGFLETCGFLKPLFRDVPLFPEGHYKTLVQEYAQERRLTARYLVVEEVGPANALRVTCELRVGQEVVRGTAIGKKKAEIEAAKAFARRHGIVPGGQISGQVACNSGNDSISRRRLRELARVREELRLGSECITDRQLDVVLTHVSLSKDRPGTEGNDLLCTIGSRVLDTLLNDCIYSNYTVSHASVREVVMRVTGEDLMGKLMPEVVISCLRSSSSLTNAAAMDPQSIKSDVLKALLAQIWLNYCQTEKAIYRDAAKGLVSRLLASLEEEPLLDYTTLVQKLAQAHGFRVDGSSKSVPDSAGRSVFEFVLSVSVRSRILRARGRGTSKARARAAASRRILPALLDNSPRDTTTASIRDLVVSGGRLVRKVDAATERVETAGDGEPVTASSEAALEVHEAPETVAANERESQDDKHSLSKGSETSEQASKLPNVVPDTQSTDDENAKSHSDSTKGDGGRLEAEGEDDSVPLCCCDAEGGVDQSAIHVSTEPRLRVCIDSYDCERRGHNIEVGTWELTDLEGKAVSVATCHCRDCSVDLVDYATYRAIKDSHGPLLGDYVIVQRWRAGHVDRAIPSETPLLVMLGYGVSDAIGLTDEQRRLILSNAIEWGSLSRDQIITWLRHFCVSTANERGLDVARSRWTDDLRWLMLGVTSVQ